MKKTNKQINLFDISKIEHKSLRSDKVKTTDINILLNRVSITKKNEFKRKIMYISFAFLAVGLVGLFTLI
jgi:hypothetical protein